MTIVFGLGLLSIAASAFCDLFRTSEMIHKAILVRV
jgi:hypothetical protein